MANNFLKEKWEESSTEELSRSKGAFLAFTTNLEEGACREQFRSLMDPMLNIQSSILELKELKDM